MSQCFAHDAASFLNNLESILNRRTSCLALYEHATRIDGSISFSCARFCRRYWCKIVSVRQMEIFWVCILALIAPALVTHKYAVPCCALWSLETLQGGRRHYPLLQRPESAVPHLLFPPIHPGKACVSVVSSLEFTQRLLGIVIVHVNDWTSRSGPRVKTCLAVLVGVFNCFAVQTKGQYHPGHSFVPTDAPTRTPNCRARLSHI